MRGSATQIAMAATFLLASLTGCAADSSGSDGLQVDSKVIDVSDAPFQITECDAFLRTTKDTSGDEVPHLAITLHIKNTSEKKLTTIQALIMNYDAFGNEPNRFQYHSGEEYTVRGDIDPDDEETSDEGVFDGIAPDTGKVTCAASAAAFSDGTSWKGQQSDE